MSITGKMTVSKPFRAGLISRFFLNGVASIRKNMEHQEIWKAIPGYEGYYEASSLGRIKSINRIVGSRRQIVREKILKPYYNKKGYASVSLFNCDSCRQFLVHRLVLFAFVGDDGGVACHNDGNPRNNHASNLRWDTYANNYADMVRHGNQKTGESCSFAKLNQSQVNDIVVLRRSKTLLELSIIFGVSIDTISSICRRKTWAKSSLMFAPSVRICDSCGTEFIPFSVIGRYCSSLCRIKYHNRAKHARN